MADLILHHYAGSPFSEKIRLILGFKGLAWRSVEVPVIMPKPDVVALTGGYRRTPFLQVGADIYCDSALMARVIDQRAPAPPLFPADVAGLSQVQAQWADRELFWAAVPYALQPAGIASLLGGLPPQALKAFAADRAAFTPHLVRPTLPDASAQLGCYLAWLEQQLSDGRAFLHGAAPSIADFSVAQSAWFIRRAPPVAGVLAPFTALGAWYERVAAFGHGRSEPLGSADALALAAAEGRAGAFAPTVMHGSAGSVRRRRSSPSRPPTTATTRSPAPWWACRPTRWCWRARTNAPARCMCISPASASRSSRSPDPQEFPMKTLHGRTAVITGAASGFGLEASRIAARAGMQLVMADVQPDALELAASEIRGLGAQVLPFRLDVAQADQVEALGEAVQQRFGAPHLVFNNAGVGAGGLIWEHSRKDWEWVVGVNLMGVAHGVRVFTPMMLAAAAADPGYEGHIVNTASMAGLLNAPNMGVYNVTKHAVVALSETLYQDLSLVTDQISASVLCPYFVPTGIHQSHRNRPADMKDAARPTRSQLIAQAMSDKAVTSGKLTAGQVAQFVFDAVLARRFYVYSHPHALGGVQTRLEDIMLQRNPTDPFKERPELGEKLRADLRG